MDGFKSNKKMKSDMPCYKTGGMVKKAAGGKADMKDEMQDKKLVKKAVKQHDDNMHGGKKETLKLKQGGKPDTRGANIARDNRRPSGSKMAERVVAKPRKAATPSASERTQVPPFGQESSLPSGSMPATMGGYNQGGVVNHHHYYGGGEVRMAGGGMVPPMGGPAMGGDPGMGAPAAAGMVGAPAENPQLMMLKKRLQQMAQQGQGGAPGGMPPQAAAGGGGLGGGGLGGPPPQAGGI